MTLAQYRTQLWELTKTSPELLRIEAANDFLNQGWEQVAEETGALRTLKKTNTEVGVDEYELDEDFISPLKVQYSSDGLKLTKTLVRKSPEVLERMSTDPIPGTPKFYCVSLKTYDTDRGKFILRIWPPAATAVEDGLWCLYVRRPTWITRDEDIPDLPGTLARAGLYLAVFMVNREALFYELYRMALATWYRTGIDTMPGYSRSPGFGGK